MSDPTMYHSSPINGTPQLSMNDHNLLMLQAASAHPLLTRIANALSTRLRLSPTQHTHLRWFFHYVFHPPALACFLIGFFGLLSVQIQLIAVGPLEAKFSNRAASAVTDFSNVIVTSVNNSMFNQSSLYANDINGRVDAIQTTINSGVFGWVNGTTTTLNDTLNEFYNDIQSIVTTVFNGTILENPARDFVQCIIGSKVDALESALTFLNENLKVNIPRVNQSILILSPGEVNEATQPISEAALGGGQDDKQGLVGRLVNAYVDSLKKERIMFGVFMGLWAIVVLMAITIILWNSYGSAWMEARGRRRWEREQRSRFSGIVVPFRGGKDPVDANEKGIADLPVFTPMPSPGLGISANDWPTGSEESESEPKRNWDDEFFAARNSREALQKPAMEITKPMKLMAISRKRLGVEKFVGDRVQEGPTPGNVQPENNTSWFSRIRGMARGKTSSGDDDNMTGGKPRPKLTIAVDRASSFVQAGDSQDARVKTPNDPPSSAWSVTPPATAPRILPWADRIAPVKKSNNSGLGLPPRPKFRPAVSVPSSVNSTYEDAPVRVEKQYGLAVPVHIGFERAPPRSPLNPTSFLAPPPDRHRRSSSVPSGLLPADRGSDSSTLVTRLLTTTHARQSSSLNPFATPFDDEHQVMGPRDSRGPGANPFTFAM